MRFVLVHSPAVGPTTWRPVAEELRRRGHAADVPHLAAAGPIRGWRDCVDAVVAAVSSVDEPVALAGHSNAGLLLPAIGAAVAAPIASLLFVDAPIPVTSGDTPLAPPWFLEQLRSIAEDGMLPPWSTWFGDDVMRLLVPDDDLRETLVREMPSLPLAYYVEAAPAPAGWDAAPCAYLMFSPAYAEFAEQARGTGWPVEEFAGAEHLHLVVDPAAVADAMLRLAVSAS
jgi:hypothetical protein